MKIVRVMKNAVAGSAAATALVRALPIFGAVGAITPAGLVATALIGVAASIIDELDT